MARSYNGYYGGLSIRSWEFDSPTSRQVLPCSSNGRAVLLHSTDGGSIPSQGTKTCSLINCYSDPEDKKRCDNRGWFPSVDGGIRKDRSNLTGAGNARIFPGRGAGGGMRDG